jgi:hypothetical protein
MKRELIGLLRRLEKIPHTLTDVSVSVSFTGWQDLGWRYSGCIFFPDSSCHISGDCATTDEVAEILEKEYAIHFHSK